MTGNPACFARMWKVGRKVGATFSVINSAEGVIVIPAEDKGVWRCFAVERLGQGELHPGAWHTESLPKRQTCMDEVNFDIDDQPGDDPQNGQ